jgi:hypothetical protein
VLIVAAGIFYYVKVQIPKNRYKNTDSYSKSIDNFDENPDASFTNDHESTTF